MAWAGVRALMRPNDWIGFVPDIVGDFIDPEIFLVGHSVLMVVAASALLVGFWRSLFAFFAFVNLVGILFYFGIDDVTFRDVGLALVALVLFLRELKIRA